MQIPPAGHGIDAGRDRVTLSKKIRKMSAEEKRRKSFPATAARPAAEPQFSWGTEQRQDLYARSDSTSIPIHRLSHGSYVVLDLVVHSWLFYILGNFTANPSFFLFLLSTRSITLSIARRNIVEFLGLFKFISSSLINCTELGQFFHR